MRSFLLFALSLCISVPAQAPIAWDLHGIHEVAAPISQLNPPDRHEILKRLQIVASQLRAEALTIDGEQTYAVQATGPFYCGASGNCSFWILDAQHKILLQGSAQQFKYLSEKHNGRDDILTILHDSAFDSYLAHWRFDGNRYRKAACARADYADIDGNVYPKPHITRSKCD